MKKLGYLLIPILLVSNLSFAAGKAYVSSNNETSTPIAIVDSSSNMIAVTGDSTNGIDVDVTRVSGTVTVSPEAATPSASNSLSVDKSASLEASSVSKASAGKFCIFQGRIDSTAASATYYLQFLNSSSVPADGAVTHLIAPIKIVHVSGSDDNINVDLLGPDGISCVYASTGIVWDLSTTEFTKTISSAYVSGTLLYQ